MKPITSTDDLAALCARLNDAPFITVDTEFMRESTYYSKLCLVQVASTDDAALIDPLADGIDLDPLLHLLANPSVLKVFHAARQDIEIFYRLMDSVPAPLFDTQVAAMATGHGDQIGYEPLVRAVTGAAVDKGSRFTDWSKRPLSDKQLTYALGDVTHLIDVYRHLSDELADKNRGHWVSEEMDALLDPALYFTAPDEAWRRLKMRNVRPKELGVIMEVAAWREVEAQKRDTPRSRVLKDDAIVELGRARPTTQDDLGALRGIPRGFERSRAAQGLIEAIKAGLDRDRDDLPELSSSRPRTPAPTDVVDLLRVLLKRQCEHYNVASRLIASAADLEALALDDDADIPALRGWRREVFGETALRLKHGELALGLSGQSVTLIER